MKTVLVFLALFISIPIFIVLKMVLAIVDFLRGKTDSGWGENGKQFGKTYL